MYGRSDPQQQWTVHAEFTIKHDGLEDGHAPPQTHTERDENGVRMVYTWTGHHQNQSSDSSQSASSASTEKNARDPQLPYGFQRGNLVFTSTPPSKAHQNAHDARNASANAPLLVPDSSGYSSELLSPTSRSLPCRSAPHPYNRRCRSTCSIVLSTDFNPTKTDDAQSQCARTQSLRCQTPTVKCDRKDSFYGCGDPWCYHSDDPGRFPTLLECDECTTNSNSNSKRPSRASTYTGGRRSSPSESKLRDASVQTFEMIDKCTSPFLRTDFGLKDSDSEARPGGAKNSRKKIPYGSKRKTAPSLLRSTHSPSSFTPDSLESEQQPARRTVRMPATKFVPNAPETTTPPDSRVVDPNKKPRTVHIDVYCTGTEQESSSSCSDSENKTASSPQTVFESGSFKLTHKKADCAAELPHKLSGSVKELKKKFEKDESDDDGGSSTAYPSQLSSFSAIKDFASSLSSVPPSWSTMSMSSCAIPDDDSVANTSWKDTYSDLASLLESRSSIAQTDSLDFVPRKLLQRESIEECPEAPKDLLTETSSKASLQPSDSFEYANSEDRFRIKEMEQMLRKGMQWKSPHTERKHLLQQRKLQEYMNRRLVDKDLPKWQQQSKDSDSEGTDSEEKGWSFVKDDKKLAGGDTLPSENACQKKGGDGDEPKTKGSLSDSNPLKQRFSLDPNLRSPFTLLPGIFTEQREIAEKFGRIVEVLKKPGHHIGPAKNPDCDCEHCKRHFEMFGGRNRARSWSDAAATTTTVADWKDGLKGSAKPNVIKEREEPSQTEKADVGYTDF